MANWRYVSVYDGELMIPWGDHGGWVNARLLDAQGQPVTDIQYRGEASFSEDGKMITWELSSGWGRGYGAIQQYTIGAITDDSRECYAGWEHAYRQKVARWPADSHSRWYRMGWQAAWSCRREDAQQARQRERQYARQQEVAHV